MGCRVSRGAYYRDFAVSVTGRSCDRPLVATGIVLTGGTSRRMGRDKLPLEVGGVSLLQRVANALAACCEEVLVVGESGYVPEGARFVPDLRPGRQGPLAGIEAGLSAARCRAVFVTAGDMPFLTEDLVQYLLGLLSDRTLAVVPDFEGVHPLCAAYRREIRPLVSAALDKGIRSVKELLRDIGRVRYVGGVELGRFGDPEVLLLNVNSPEDLSRARDALRDV